MAPPDLNPSTAPVSLWSRLRSVPVWGWLAALFFVIVIPLVVPQYAGRMLHNAPPLSQGLELGPFIQRVKAELAADELATIQRGEAPMLVLQQVELEVNFIAETKASGDIKLVTVNGTAEADLTRSQRVVLHLGAVPPRTVTSLPESNPIKEDGATTIGPLPPSPSGEQK